MTELQELPVDPVIPGQLWYSVSFLSPEGIKNCNHRALKIRGVYATEEEAKTHVAELHKKDPLFHIFIGRVGQWQEWDPDPNTIEDHVYHEPKLNALMEQYKKNLEDAKIAEQQRKENMLKDNVRRAATTPTTPTPVQDRLKEKLKTQKQKAIQSCDQQIKRLEEMQKKYATSST